MDETNWPTIAFLFIIVLEVLFIHIRDSSRISSIKIDSVSGVSDVSIFIQQCTAELFIHPLRVLILYNHVIQKHCSSKKVQIIQVKNNASNNTFPYPHADII